MDEKGNQQNEKELIYGIGEKYLQIDVTGRRVFIHQAHLQACIPQYQKANNKKCRRPKWSCFMKKTYDG